MKKFRLVTSLICVCALLCSCGNGAPERSAMPGYQTVTGSTTGTSAVKTEKTTEVKEEEAVRIYPKRDVDSYYAEFLQPATGEFYSADFLDRLGAPFELDGVWSVTEFDPATMLYGDNLEQIDKSTKSIVRKNAKVYSLETDIGPVLVIDIINASAELIKDAFKDDLVTLQAFKAMFENFKGYDDLPEEGENVTVMGFYCGYDEDLEMPVITYGISYLIRFTTFGDDYANYRSLKMKQAKFLNLIDYEIPAKWPAPVEKSQEYDYYMPNAVLQIFCEDDPYETTLKDTIEYFYDREFGEYAEDYNIVGDYYELPSGIPAYRASFSIPEIQGRYMFTAFLHKHKLVVLMMNISADTADTQLFEEDYNKLVNSIKLRAY